MPNRPFDPKRARKVLSERLRAGVPFVSGHARQEMDADDLTDEEVEGVLRYGRIFEPAEEVHGTWRFRVHTTEACVVIAFDEAMGVRVVTAWRKR